MLKKIIRLGTLLTIKESYLLAKNTYGLGVHPFKTLKSLGREKDRSQQLLLLGLPLYVLGMGAGLVWLGRRLLGTSVEWGIGAKVSALMFLTASTVVGIYLLFWWREVWLKR